MGMVEVVGAAVAKEEVEAGAVEAAVMEVEETVGVEGTVAVGVGVMVDVMDLSKLTLLQEKVLTFICCCFYYSRLNDYRSTKKRWDLSRLPKFEKNFYKEHPVVASRPDVSGC